MAAAKNSSLTGQKIQVGKVLASTAISTAD